MTAGLNKAIEEQADFAYYTTAETLIKIIEGKCIYMRNAKVLNDISEIKLGYAYLRESIARAEGDMLFAALRNINPSLDKERLFEDYFDNLHYPTIANNTYILSLSDHTKATSPNLGTLAMWRAYGGDAGVALIVEGKKTAFVDSDAIDAWTYPVQYVECGPNYEFGKDSWLSTEFRSIAMKLDSNRDVLKNVEQERLIGHLMRAFNLAIVRTKHIAFSEEHEWRVIRTQGWKDNVKAGIPTTVTIGGVPQKVVKIGLVNHADATPNALNLELGNIIKKILVGPCVHADIIRESIIERLTAAGVPNADQRVVITNIPYRRNRG